MRRIAIAILVFAVTTTAPAEPRKWAAEVEWGDTIPGGTVYNVKFESAGSFKAERRRMLTTVVHESILAEGERSSLRQLVERTIRQVDLSKAQGSMAGDGFHVHVYLWDGTVSIAAEFALLGAWSEGGTNVAQLVRELSRRLPAKLTE